MCYNDAHKKMQKSNLEQNYKSHPSTDWALQLELMKQELLVIEDQNASVNMYLSFVHTARQIKKTASGRSYPANRKGAGA